jgi:hypothetical protein
MPNRPLVRLNVALTDDGAMAVTMPNSSSCRGAPGFTSDAIRIVERVEREIVRLENNFGRDRLLRIVADFGREMYAEHTDYYRRVIRETTWPHGPWVGGAHADFVRGYGFSALGYVWGGFEALQFFARASERSIDQVYEYALAAESLRGHFGKSSPFGLDRRLDQLGDRFVAEFGDEKDLVALCTPVAPIRTAEAALLEDFADFRGVFPKPPTIEDVLGVPDRDQDRVWTFLRRHVRWNVGAAARLYDELPCDIRTGAVAVHNVEQGPRERLLSTLSPTAIAVVDAITSLNVLNLVLEPAFSFKGGVGLPLGMVFRRVRHAERRPPLDEEKLIRGMRRLFTLAQHRSCDD